MADTPILMHAVVNLFMVVVFFIIAPLFVGTLLQKAFVYATAWMFSLIISSLSAFAASYLERAVTIGYFRWMLVLKIVFLGGVYTFARGKLSKSCEKIFAVFRRRFPLQLAIYPMIIIVAFLFFIPEFNRDTDLGDNASFYVLFTLISLSGYILILQNAMQILERQRAEADLEFARQIVKEQKGHYNMLLESMENIRILRHDYLMHIRALQCMTDKQAVDEYLQKLLSQYQRPPRLHICENQFVNDLMSLYANQCEEEKIDLQCAMFIPSDIEIDELDLCTVIGNLMQNALDACARLQTGRFIRVNARYEARRLFLVMENSFDGIVIHNGSRLVSRKQIGGIGFLSIQRITDAPNNDFDFSYDDRVFTAMATISAK
jgi:signal transduction histidine kinase